MLHTETYVNKQRWLEWNNQSSIKKRVMIVTIKILKEEEEKLYDHLLMTHKAD